jgi:hypothetical protein
MLWPLVLPVQFTLAILFGCVVVVTVFAPHAKLKRLPVFLVASFLAIVAFIPSCSVVMRVIDGHRFGVFEYPTFAGVADMRVERYLPHAATEITLEKRAGGFRAKFRIDEAQLRSYVDASWNESGGRSVAKRDESSSIALKDTQWHRLFDDLGWPPLDDAKEFQGPTAANGAGFVVWYSPSKSIAYERAGYW